MKLFKVAAAIALCMILTITASAGNILKGSFIATIKDALTGNPIEGVSVYFSDVKVGGITNANGEIVINNIPEGKHLIEITHVGYNTISEYVDIIGETKKEYVLSHTVVESNTVIVTGTTGATQLKKVPFQVAVLNKEELLQNNATNIIDALAKKPGVSTLSTGPAISKPVIRGLGYNRVLTINDGVRQEGQQWGDEHGIEIDEASVNKVEILKGPASLIYGSDATAGVINIITNVPVANNTLKGNIFSGYQTNNRSTTNNISLAGNRNNLNWNVYTSVVSAEDYKNKYDGSVFNSKFSQKNFGGYVGYNGNWGYSHLLLSKFNLKAGLIEGDRDNDGYFIKPVAGGGEERATEADFKSRIPLVPYQNIQHFKIATDNSFKLGKQRLSINVGYQHNQRKEFGNVDDLNERELFFDLKTITYAAQLHLQEMKGWKTSIGINGMHQTNTNKGLEQLIPDYDLFDVGGYVYTRKTIKKITLSGGARYDTRNIHTSDLMNGLDVKGPAIKRSFANFSGSLGIAAQISHNLNVKLNIARGFRAPSIPELASNGAHEGTTRYEYGNSDLKSEVSTQIDAGFDFNTEHVSFDLSVFYNNFSNFILYRKLQNTGGTDSLINVDGQDLTAFQFEQTKASLTGIEATVDFHPHPLDWLHIENTFSFVTGRLKQSIEGNKFLPFIPAPRLITEFRGNIKKIRNHISNGYVKFEIDNTFKQHNIFKAYNTETATSGYTLLNAGLGADIVSKKGNTFFSVHLIATNITDVAYQNHLSRLKYAAENMSTGRTGVFNMGRNFTIKLNVPLNFSLNAGR
ncbi:TonB-dependent receptor [Ferruginibacter sp. SUN002]|uniref:TonB-dependent receptor n=1 Tax=Ferruginibacter sp. SUN002 TaxID=2937789 RepID=UPI003D35B987